MLLAFCDSKAMPVAPTMLIVLESYVACCTELCYSESGPVCHFVWHAGTVRKTPGWMNVLPDMSAAPIVSKDAEAANDGKVHL